MNDDKNYRTLKSATQQKLNSKEKVDKIKIKIKASG
jgi:hypothetical protein